MSGKGGVIWFLSSVLSKAPDENQEKPKKISKLVPKDLGFGRLGGGWGRGFQLRIGRNGKNR